MESILNYFPIRIRELIEYEVQNKTENLEEIRIRVDRPIILKFNSVEKILKYYIKSDEILNILHLICENSIYSYQNQIAEGFITIKGRA